MLPESSSLNQDNPRLKLQTFEWMGRYYHLAIDCTVVGKDWRETQDCFEAFGVWQSEVFGIGGKYGQW